MSNAQAQAGVLMRLERDELAMRGSITRLNKKMGCGFILGDDGCEAYFDISSLEGTDIRALSVGKAVEYQERFRQERLRAASVKILGFSQSCESAQPQSKPAVAVSAGNLQTQTRSIEGGRAADVPTSVSAKSPRN